MKEGYGNTGTAAQPIPHKIKIGVKGSQDYQAPLRDEWYINDMGQLMGPLQWRIVTEMAERAHVTPMAQIRNADWQEWAPMWQYVRIRTPGELEAEALMPSRYDGIFFLGVVLFIMGIVGIIISPWMGIPLLMVSPAIEFEALFWESKNKAKATMRSFGNAIAIFWIVVQVLITAFFIMAFMQI